MGSQLFICSRARWKIQLALKPELWNFKLHDSRSTGFSPGIITCYDVAATWLQLYASHLVWVVEKSLPWASGLRPCHFSHMIHWASSRSCKNRVYVWGSIGPSSRVGAQVLHLTSIVHPKYWALVGTYRVYRRPAPFLGGQSIAYQSWTCLTLFLIDI